MDALSTLLSDIRVHGYLALWVIVFLGSAGIPLPTDPVVLAAGALAGHGELNPVAVGLVIVTAAACGDAVGYFAGWKVGKRATDWLEHSRVGRRIIPLKTLERGRAYFARYGGWAIFLSRWLVGMFSGVVNLLAGERRFPFPAFLVYATVGEAIDAAIMLAIGITFGATLAAADTDLEVVSLVIVALLGIAFLAIRLLYPVWQRRSSASQPQLDGKQPTAP